MVPSNFTNFDVFAISKELDLILANSSITNVYEVEDLVILKINTKNDGRKNLIIKSDSRINITDYDYPVPQYPSQYIMSLRKFLKKSWMDSSVTATFFKARITSATFTP